jgi:hypothetical protein
MALIAKRTCWMKSIANDCTKTNDVWQFSTAMIKSWNVDAYRQLPIIKSAPPIAQIVSVVTLIAAIRKNRSKKLIIVCRAIHLAIQCALKAHRELKQKLVHQINATRDSFPTQIAIYHGSM